jgi:hypothetical protein
VDLPLLVLLLPVRLERFHLQDRAHELLRAPGVVAVDPSRLPPGRLPPTVAAGLAIGQARRMRLPGRVAAVAIFHPVQFYLAGALLARHHHAELWYGRIALEPDAGAHLVHLDATAAERAALTSTPEDLLARAPLRMAELGIPASGISPTSEAGA